MSLRCIKSIFSLQQFRRKVIVCASMWLVSCSADNLPRHSALFGCFQQSQVGRRENRSLSPQCNRSRTMEYHGSSWFIPIKHSPIFLDSSRGSQSLQTVSVAMLCRGWLQAKLGRSCRCRLSSELNIVLHSRMQVANESVKKDGCQGKHVGQMVLCWQESSSLTSREWSQQYIIIYIYMNTEIWNCWFVSWTFGRQLLCLYNFHIPVSPFNLLVRLAVCL